MIPFLRLTRPVNLIIIAITMYGLGWYFDETVGDTYWGIGSFHFFLLVISTVMIAAAGNIINDYFDVRADRINKPDRLIIGKTVKRRVAIVSHWGLNFFAFAIAAYISWRLETFWYVFIHLISINVLWSYSSYFKRKFLLGNVLIAALTAMVPILVGFYYYQQLQLHPELISSARIYPFVDLQENTFVVFLSVAIACFAFVLNFSREIVKDMEDVEGDLQLKAKTIPIVLGIRTAKTIATLTLLTGILMIGLLSLLFPRIEISALAPVYFSGFLMLVAAISLWWNNHIKTFKWVNFWIKIAMIFGLLSPMYWKFLLTYG